MANTRVIRGSLATAQERFEATRLGEIAISTLIALILITAVAWSMPESAIRRKAVAVVEPVALLSGLDQAWFMFAPDPYRRLETVEVHLETAQGEERVWTFPSGGALTQFTWYRWHKLKEQAVRTPAIRADVVRWVAAEVLAPADYPAQASMVLITDDIVPAGSGAEVGSPVTDVLHTEDLVGPP
jgi:hypothetical protein